MYNMRKTWRGKESPISYASLKCLLSQISFVSIFNRVYFALYTHTKAHCIPVKSYFHMHLHGTKEGKTRAMYGRRLLIPPPLCVISWGVKSRVQFENQESKQKTLLLKNCQYDYLKEEHLPAATCNCQKTWTNLSSHTFHLVTGVNMLELLLPLKTMQIISSLPRFKP